MALQRGTHLGSVAGCNLRLSPIRTLGQLSDKSVSLETRSVPLENKWSFMQTSEN